MINNTCLTHSTDNSELLIKLGLGTEVFDENNKLTYDPYKCYTSILPYLADYLYKKGYAIEYVQTDADEILKAALENIEEVKPYIDVLRKTFINMDNADFKVVQTLVDNADTNNLEFTNALENFVSRMDLDADCFPKDLYNHLKFQLIERMFQGTLSVEQAQSLGYKKKTQETSKSTINIYAGTGENADLSNFAKRPFTISVNPDGVKEIEMTFKSVEQYFQAEKAYFAGDLETAHKIEVSSTASEAKQLGKKVQNLNSKEWDKISSEVMKRGLLASFEQNPQALQRLLATGNATLTHTQDKGKWGTEFPRILMEVRDELRKENPQIGNSSNEQINKKEKPSPSAGQSLINSAIQKHQGNWSRQEAQNNPRILYVFTDNTDRDSGHGLIPDDSWYSKKYGTGHHFPTMTAAVIRGLDNSRPISTQRWYHQGAKDVTGRWTDANVEEFKQVIREELQEIVKEYNTGKYDTIMFPDGDGLFNTRISSITKARTPKLYQALADLLYEYGFDSLIPTDVSPTQNIQQQSNFDVSEAEFYSGAADGSDKEWGSQARALGIKVKDYVVQSYRDLTQEWKNKIEQEYTEARAFLGKPKLTGYSGELTRRDMMQADKADAVFAIAERIVKPGEKELSNGKEYTNNTSHDNVQGGTANAVARGILRGIPVYVFDQSDNKWKVWDKNSNSFVETEMPTLTPHAATIGTRDINEAGKQAIKDILNITINQPIMQTIASTMVANQGSEAVKGTIDSMEGRTNPLNEQEQKQAKTILGTTKPKVLMASEHTDPVFHAKKIIQMVKEEQKKPIKERRFHMLQLMTKHDGLPLRELLELNIPKSIHFSITSLGGTKWEPGVMKADDLLDRIEAFIKEGLLKPQTVTIRIDPIIPGVTIPKDVEHIVERASKMGIKQFKFSVLDSYGYLDGAGNRDRFVISKMNELGYDWDKYFGRDSQGKVYFDAKTEYQNKIYSFMDNLGDKYGIKFNTCGERPSVVNIPLKNIKFNIGCLNVSTINSVLGVNDVEQVENNQRKGCSCYGGKIDALKYNDNCASSCVYCYAKHNSDIQFNYYNEDGTLKKNAFTATNKDQIITEVKKVEKKISGPQPFKFKDGTTIEAPFKVNKQQEDALNALDEFVKSDERAITLSGYAGTGKTSIMEIFAKKMDKNYKSVVFSATTNKAAQVLSERLKKSHNKAYTVNKVFGIRVEVNDKLEYYDASELVDKIVKSKILKRNDIVVIDEASMLSKKHYDILNEIADNLNLKIIYVGDSAQLPPVNDSDISPVFRDSNIKVVSLTQVERTGDNAILREATALRNNQSLSKESSFNANGQGVAYINTNNTNSKNNVIQHYVEGIAKDSNYFKILAYTNKAVSNYNDYVRSLLGYNDAIPRTGELLMAYDNFGYNTNGDYDIVNSEIYKITSVASPTIKTFNINGEVIEIENIPLTFKTLNGKEKTFHYVDIKNNKKNRANILKLAEEKQRLWSLWRTTKNHSYVEQANAITEFLLVNDSVTEEDPITGKQRVLIKKVLDFGYATTVHKSQGGTFKHVLIDENDISTAKVRNKDQSVDAEKTNLLLQQLRYVAVSRAADTATILSDNVKVEDSPLNHLNETISESVTEEQLPKEFDYKYDTPEEIKETNLDESILGNLNKAAEIEENKKENIKQLKDYMTPIQGVTIKVQQDNVAMKMSVQQKADAIDIIAKMFNSHLAQELKLSEKDLRDKDPKAPITKLKAQQERINEDMFNRIKFEQECTNPREDVINRFKSKIIPITELDVIKLKTIPEIKKHIRDYMRDNAVMSIITENFDALFLEAASEINKRYNIDILGNFTDYEKYDTEEDDIDPDTGLSTDGNNSPENTYIRSDDRSRSTESLLSQDIKEVYDKCVLRDEYGKVVKDSFNRNKTIHQSVAHATILRLTQNIIDFNDMMNMIKTSTISWINSVDEEGNAKKGCLRYYLEQDEQLANSFYYNYKGNAQHNMVMRVGNDGVFRLISINEIDTSELHIKTLNSNIDSGNRLNSLSIYDSKGEIDKYTAGELNKKIGNLDIQAKNTPYNKLPETFFKEIIEVLNSLGFSVDNDFNIIEGIKYVTNNPNATDKELSNSVISLLADCSQICSKIQKAERKDIIITKEYNSYYTNIAKYLFIGEKQLSESAHTENGKNYNTYGKTNFLDELFLKLKKSVKNKKTSEGKDFYDAWLQENFKSLSFFYYNNKWLSDWLEKLTEKSNVYRNLLERVNVIDTNVLGDKHEYTEWNEEESTLTNFLAYLNGPDNVLSSPNEKAAYYRMTIASNSPAGDFIRFIKYVSSADVSYESIISKKMWNVCKQELIRMNDVIQHLQKRIDGTTTTPNIKSYDPEIKSDGTLKTAGGLVFSFMPRLNYIKVNGNQKIFEKIPEEDRVAYINKPFVDVIKSLDSNEKRVAYNLTEDDLESFFTEIWLDDFNEDFEQEYKTVYRTLVQNAQLSNLDSVERLQDAYREYCMNYTLAFAQMVQLTTTDLAYFGAKSVKEVSANENYDFRCVLNINGEDVTKYYQIVADNTLDVFQKRNKEYHAPVKKISTKNKTYFREATIKDIEIVSEILENVKLGIKNNKYLSSKLKSKILNTIEKAFSEVNVADGQSYRSLESYMEILEAAGKLDADTRECFNAIKNGRLDDGTFYKVFLALKPYFYGTVKHERDTVDANGKPYVTSKATQHKNSEYPLMVLTIAAGALGNSTLLKGINQFMVKNNIDVVHFHSVVKTGLTGTIKVPLHNKTADEITTELTNQIRDVDGKEKNIEEVRVDYWGLQTEKPEHLVDKQQLIGSQPRRLILADIPDTNPDGTPYIIRVKGREYTKKEFIEHYQELITEDLLEDFSAVDNMFNDINTLSKFLQNHVASSNKFDDDMIRMFSVDETGKKFVLPVWDATVSNKVDEILNALIRNRIVKQTIKGGAVVQTAAVGLNTKLNVRYKREYKNEKGELIKEKLYTFNEWLQRNPKGTIEQYEKYAEGATVDYMECYLPFWSKDLIEKYIIDGRIVADDFPEELKYLIGYRVPTEDHYSMCPLKVVGFLTPAEGSSIVLPADITAIAGSDFDIDVLYLMLPEHQIYKHDMKKAAIDYTVSTGSSIDFVKYISESKLNSHDPNVEEFNRWFNVHKDDLDDNGNPKYLLSKKDWIVQKVKYNEKKPASKNSRAARHNEFIDMCFGCLTSEHSLEKFSNPQNYNEHKIASRLCELNPYIPYEKLATELSLYPSDKDKIKYLDGLLAAIYKKRNISSPKTATDLHQQNMTGNALIGIAAVGNAVQQILEYTPLRFTSRIVINGNKSNGGELILGRQRNSYGQLITKNIAGYLAAFVDNGKDPIAKALQANPDNMKYILFLSMLGYTPLEIGAFLNIPIIKELMSNPLAEIKKPEQLGVLNNLNVEDIDSLTIDEMMKAAANPNSEQAYLVNITAKEMFNAVADGAEQLSKRFNQLLRADSVNGNVSKSIISALHKKKVYDNLLLSQESDTLPFIPIKDIPTNPNNDLIPVKYIISNTVEEIRKVLQNSALPYLQAFTSCGTMSSIKWLRKFSLIIPFEEILDQYVLRDNWSEKKQEKVMRKLFSEFQMYYLLNNPIFGRESANNITYADKLNYYIHDFPEEFNNWKQNLSEDLKNNLFVQNINYIKEDSSNTDTFAHLVVADLGGSKYSRNQFKLEFDKLMNTNPDMAIKLFVYSAIRNGLSFSPEGWTHLVSTEAKLAIPGYVENVQTLITLKPSERFIEFFIRNNYRSIKGLVPTINITATNIEKWNNIAEGFNANLNKEEYDKLEKTINRLPQYFQADNKLFRKIVFETEDGVKNIRIDELEGLGCGQYYHEYHEDSIFNQDNINNKSNSDDYIETGNTDIIVPNEYDSLDSIDKVNSEDTVIFNPDEIDDDVPIIDESILDDDIPIINMDDLEVEDTKSTPTISEDTTDDEGIPSCH